MSRKWGAVPFCIAMILLLINTKVLANLQIDTGVRLDFQAFCRGDNPWFTWCLFEDECHCLEISRRLCLLATTDVTPIQMPMRFRFSGGCNVHRLRTAPPGNSVALLGDYSNVPTTIINRLVSLATNNTGSRSSRTVPLASQTTFRLVHFGALRVVIKLPLPNSSTSNTASGLLVAEPNLPCQTWPQLCYPSSGRRTMRLVPSLVFGFMVDSTGQFPGIPLKRSPTKPMPTTNKLLEVNSHFQELAGAVTVKVQTVEQSFVVDIGPDVELLAGQYGDPNAPVIVKPDGKTIVFPSLPFTSSSLYIPIAICMSNTRLCRTSNVQLVAFAESSARVLLGPHSAAKFIGDRVEIPLADTTTEAWLCASTSGTQRFISSKHGLNGCLGPKMPDYLHLLHRQQYHYGMNPQKSHIVSIPVAILKGAPVWNLHVVDHTGAHMSWLISNTHPDTQLDGIFWSLVAALVITIGSSVLLLVLRYLRVRSSALHAHTLKKQLSLRSQHLKRTRSQLSVCSLRSSVANTAVLVPSSTHSFSSGSSESETSNIRRVVNGQFEVPSGAVPRSISRTRVDSATPLSAVGSPAIRSRSGSITILQQISQLSHSEAVSDTDYKLPASQGLDLRDLTLEESMMLSAMITCYTENRRFHFSGQLAVGEWSTLVSLLNKAAFLSNRLLLISPLLAVIRSVVHRRQSFIAAEDLGAILTLITDGFATFESDHEPVSFRSSFRYEYLPQRYQVLYASTLTALLDTQRDRGVRLEIGEAVVKLVDDYQTRFYCSSYEKSLIQRLSKFATVSLETGDQLLIIDMIAKLSSSICDDSRYDYPLLPIEANEWLDEAFVASVQAVVQYDLSDSDSSGSSDENEETRSIALSNELRVRLLKTIELASLSEKLTTSQAHLVNHLTTDSPTELTFDQAASVADLLSLCGSVARMIHLFEPNIDRFSHTPIQENSESDSGEEAKKSTEITETEALEPTSVETMEESDRAQDVVTLAPPGLSLRPAPLYWDTVETPPVHHWDESIDETLSPLGPPADIHGGIADQPWPFL